jgi:hypothetical protein
MRDTTLLQLALALTPPWTVSRSDFDAEGHRLDIEIDFPRQSLCPSELRCRGLPGLRHRVENLASPQLLPASGLLECPRAARALRHLRHQDRRRAMGAAGQRLHPARPKRRPG